MNFWNELLYNLEMIEKPCYRTFSPLHFDYSYIPYTCCGRLGRPILSCFWEHSENGENTLIIGLSLSKNLTIKNLNNDISDKELLGC